MQFISTKDLEKATVLGMLINVRKGHPKVMLLEYNNDYYLYDMRWKCGETQFYYSVNKWTTTKQFNNKEACSYYWKIFTEMRDYALQNHIYI